MTTLTTTPRSSLSILSFPRPTWYLFRFFNFEVHWIIIYSIPVPPSLISLLDVQLQVMTILMNYKRTVEDFKKCGSKASTVYGLPYVSDCVAPGKSFSCPDMVLPVPCGDGKCHSDYISCLRVSKSSLLFAGGLAVVISLCIRNKNYTENVIENISLEAFSRIFIIEFGVITVHQQMLISTLTLTTVPPFPLLFLSLFRTKLKN